MQKTYDVAVVGATGMVGEALVEILSKRGFPVGRVHALASERSVGRTVSFGNQEIDVGNLAEFDFSTVHDVNVAVTIHVRRIAVGGAS